MATPNPQPRWMQEPTAELTALMQEILSALMEFTGASVGWIGLLGPQGQLSFPARQGDLPSAWLTLQQGDKPPWGFAVQAGLTLLNEVPPWPLLGRPSLSNLLTCSLAPSEEPSGYLLLANKINGFTSHDATVVQSTAHLISKLLTQQAVAAKPRWSPGLLACALDHAPEGILIVGHTGQLLFANATWARWTGFPAAALCGRPAPHPFWVSHRDLAALGGPLPVLPQALAPKGTDLVSSAGERRIGYLPFRHRNHSLFWCQVETRREEFAGEQVTVAFLRRLPETAVSGQKSEVRGQGEAAVLSSTSDHRPLTADDGAAVSFQALAAALPFAVALTDQTGRILWANQWFCQNVCGGAPVLGQPLRDSFAPLSAAALERLIHDPTAAQRAERGRLLLEPLAAAGSREKSACLATFWQTIGLSQGPGFAFAFAEDWEELWSGSQEATGEAQLPQADWLVLLLRPSGALEYWDERWERLTGLTRQEVMGSSGDLLLDWLFPREIDRNFVADLLQQPARQSAQTVLEVAGRERRRPLLCTFLPLTGVAGGTWQGAREQRIASLTTPEEAWLILACEPPSAAGENSSVGRFLRQFTRGLSHLLNNYLTVPIGLAEMALERTDLPAEVAAWFGQILESCMRAGRLIASLQDLALITPGSCQRLALADVLRTVVAELAAEVQTPPYELALDVQSAGAMVEANPRLLKIVLRHLLTNAVHALVDPQRRHITARVFADATNVYCEIQDTGEGLVPADWTAVLAPFYSTKGPFAREAGHASHDATGLGLTVSQHLLALHGGRLELQSAPGVGTTARLMLPRAQGVSAGMSAPALAADTLRADAPMDITGPHSRESAISEG